MLGLDAVKDHVRDFLIWTVGLGPEAPPRRELPPPEALHHKIKHAMAAREVVHRCRVRCSLTAPTSVANTAPGRQALGSKNEVPLVAAALLGENGGPLYVKLQRLKAFTSASIQGLGLGRRWHRVARSRATAWPALER